MMGSVYLAIPTLLLVITGACILATRNLPNLLELFHYLLRLLMLWPFVSLLFSSFLLVLQYSGVYPATIDLPGCLNSSF